MAFGLAISGNPLSLYTLYGVIALSGIAVNSAIVLIDAANSRLAAGMGTAHAIVQAGRRRVVPVLITTTTTVGGLFALAFGIGGSSAVLEIVGYTMLVLMPVCVAVTLWGTPDAQVPVTSNVPLLKGLALIVKNRPFLQLASAFTSSPTS